MQYCRNEHYIPCNYLKIKNSGIYCMWFDFLLNEINGKGIARCRACELLPKYKKQIKKEI